MSELGRVPYDRAAAFGIAERPPQHDVDLMDGLGVEAAAPVGPASLEEACIETVEVLGPQVPKRDTTQVGEYVELDESPVAVPCARSKSQLLGR